MSLRRSGIRRSGGPRRHQGLNPRSRKQAKRDRVFAAAKLLVFERDGYRCGLCKREGSPRVLEAHHLRMRSQGGSDEPENLATVCHWCHSHLHESPAWSYQFGWLVRSGGGA